MKPLAFISRLGPADRDALTGALAAMTAHADCLPEALHTYAADPANKRIAPVLLDVCRRMENGAAFSEALDAHAGSFPPVYRCMIRAGEERGDLRNVLRLLAERGRPDGESPRTLRGAGVYLAVLLLLCWVVIGYLLVFVVPLFAKIFGEFGGSLPGPTELVVSVSRYVSSAGYAAISELLLVAVGLGLVGRWLRLHGFGSRATDYLMLRLPGSGRRRYTDLSVAFCRSLGLMLAAGLPVSKSLGLAGEASHNAILRDAAYGAAQRVEGGESLAGALDNTGFFASSTGWLWRHAEGNGLLADSLLAFADAHQRQQRSAYEDALASVLLPFLCFLFFVVGFVMVSLYLPVFALGDCISGV